MLREGVFVTPEETYSLYEIDTNGFFRFDIIEHNAVFQIDIGSVKYSIVQRKHAKTFGDASLYTKYLSLKGRATSSKLQTTKESGWDEGVFKTHIHSQSRDGKVTIDTELVNNRKLSETIVIDGYTIYMYEADASYDIKLDPINFSEYSESKLSKDTILTDDPNAPYHSVETLRRRLPLDHIYENDFVVADTVDIARKRLSEWIMSDEPYLGFDTETTGLDINLYGEDKLVGIILGESETKSTYFPFRHVEDFNLPMWFMSELMAQVKLRESRLVAHNKKFDREVMLSEGYDLQIRWCTYQISIVLDPQVGKDHPHDLKTLIWLLTRKRYAELDDIFINSKDINFARLNKELVHLYACADGSNVITLIKDQMKRLPKYQYMLAETECDLADLKADQEFYGIRVDVKKYEKQYHNCLYIREQLLDAFRRLTKEDGNINSSAVLQNLLYNKMRCDILLRTNTGQPSVSSAAIKKLAAKKTDKPHPIPKSICDLNGKEIVKGEDLAKAKYPALLILNKYKEYNKLITAFYARFERTMKTGRVFFWINQNGAQSGRQSSPMHQLPPALKECILSDADDRDFWGPDYSQIELRMIAYLSGEKELIELCSVPENDVHRVIGSLISGLEMWEITPAMRSVGKRRNFGVVYKITAYGLAAQLYGPGFTEEQKQFAQQQLDDFYKRFKRIRRFIQYNAKFVQEKGYMETKWLHRRRMFPEIFDPDIEPRKKSSILRMSNNMPVQGTAADYLKLAEVLMYKYIRKKGWNELKEDGFPLVRMMLSIHDEIIISADRSIPYEEIITMITECMEIPVEGAPPFFVQPVKMDNWGDHAAEGLVLPVKLRDKLIADYKATGKSVINCDNYAQVVHDYNAGILHDYMVDLVSKYGTDYKAVGEHVRHPVLTHDLLGMYEKRISWDLEHVDRINEAAKLYIEERILGGGGTPHVIFSVQPEDKQEDAEVKDTLEQEYGELEQLVTCDADGNVIYEDNEPTDTDDYYYDDSEDYEEVLADAKNEPTYVYELGDCVVFDVNEVSSDNINKLLKYIASIASTDGFYRTLINYNDKLLDTKMRIENIDLKAVNKMILDMMEDTVCTM